MSELFPVERRGAALDAGEQAGMFGGFCAQKKLASKHHVNRCGGATKVKRSLKWQVTISRDGMPLHLLELAGQLGPLPLGPAPYADPGKWLKGSVLRLKMSFDLTRSPAGNKFAQIYARFIRHAKGRTDSEDARQARAGHGKNRESRPPFR
jgi:hypothetical protein